MDEARLIRSPLFAGMGITAFFTERHHGASSEPFASLNLGFGLGDDEYNVQHNMELIRQAGGLQCPPHTARQVHGVRPIWCSGAGRQHTGEADMLLTREAGCAVAVRTADCLPILLADPQAGIAAAVHAGWRGTAASIVLGAVEAMVDNGAARERINASLGPAIGPCCFETGEDVAGQLAATVSGGERHLHRIPAPHIDLAGLNISQLLEAGLRESRIENLSCCTACHPERFFSHRRDSGRTGRHLAVVALPGHA